MFGYRKQIAELKNALNDATSQLIMVRSDLSVERQFGKDKYLTFIFENDALRSQINVESEAREIAEIKLAEVASELVELHIANAELFNQLESMNDKYTLMEAQYNAMRDTLKKRNDDARIIALQHATTRTEGMLDVTKTAEKYYAFITQEDEQTEDVKPEPEHAHECKLNSAGHEVEPGCRCECGMTYTYLSGWVKL